MDDGEYIYIRAVVSYPDARRLTEADYDQVVDDLIELVEGKGLIIGGSFWLGDDDERSKTRRQGLPATEPSYGTAHIGGYPQSPAKRGARRRRRCLRPGAPSRAQPGRCLSLNET